MCRYIINTRKNFSIRDVDKIVVAKLINGNNLLHIADEDGLFLRQVTDSQVVTDRLSGSSYQDRPNRNRMPPESLFKDE